MLEDGDRKTLFSVGGFISLAFFMFATRSTKTIAFLVFPMLAMCFVADLRLAVIFCILTATMFGNLALHDPALEPLAAGWIAEKLPEWLPYTVRALITPPNLQALSVVLNFYALALWLATFIWGGIGTVTAKERQRRAAWAAFVGGGATLVLAVFAVMTILKPACPAGSTDPGVRGNRSPRWQNLDQTCRRGPRADRHFGRRHGRPGGATEPDDFRRARRGVRHRPRHAGLRRVSRAGPQALEGLTVTADSSRRPINRETSVNMPV